MCTDFWKDLQMNYWINSYKLMNFLWTWFNKQWKLNISYQMTIECTQIMGNTLFEGLEIKGIYSLQKKITSVYK